MKSIQGASFYHTSTEGRADFGNPSETDGTASLMKTRHRQIKLGLSWKLPPCWAAFKVPESATQAAGGEETSTGLPSCVSYELQY